MVKPNYNRNLQNIKYQWSLIHDRRVRFVNQRSCLMNAIGEIRQASNYQKEIWLACEGCGRERWVRLLRNKPRHILCNACARDKKIEQQCLICGNKFKVHRYLVAGGYGMYCSKGCRVIAQSRRMTGDKHPMWNGGKILFHCQECGKPFEDYPSIKRRFCSCSCHVIYQRKHGEFCKPLNGKETILLSLIQKANLPFKYVGGGEVWLGNRNPDFINTNGKKQVIELFGTYWHPIFDVAQRREHYRQYGFDCLVVWEDELSFPEKTTTKIRKYVRV